MRMQTHLLLLPGNHPSILEWMKELQVAIGDLFGSNQVVEYAHWAQAGAVISLEAELSRLSKQPADLAILAKSAGVLLALKGVQEKQFLPKFCIFIGTPVTASQELGFTLEELFQGYKCKTLYIQNNLDPAGSSEQLRIFVQRIGQGASSFVELEGTTHDYDDIDLLKKHIGRFVSSM